MLNKLCLLRPLHAALTFKHETSANIIDTGHFSPVLFSQEWLYYVIEKENSSLLSLKDNCFVHWFMADMNIMRLHPPNPPPLSLTHTLSLTLSLSLSVSLTLSLSLSLSHSLPLSLSLNAFLQTIYPRKEHSCLVK